MRSANEPAMLTLAEAIRDALAEEMERDENVSALGLDIGRYGGPYRETEGLLEKFGEERVRDTPIAENGAVGVAVGAALAGLRVVWFTSQTDFAYCAFDQIVNEAAKIRYASGGRLKVPIVLAMANGAVPGCGMGVQHSQTGEGVFLSFPGLKVVAPSTPSDAKGLMKSAIRDDNPVVFLESRELLSIKGPVPADEYTIPLGLADIKKEGNDVTVVATLSMVPRAIRAAEMAGQDGLHAEVIDPRTLHPLDRGTILKSVEKTGFLLTVEEGAITGGFGSEVTAAVTEKGFRFLKGPTRRIGNPGAPVPSSHVLEAGLIPNERAIVEAMKEVRRG